MSIQKLIDDYISEKKHKDHKGSGKISPSSLGRCFRFQYWKRKGEPATNPPDLVTLRKFKAGELFHDFVQQRLPDHQKEVLVERDDIKGFCDVVGKDYVAEIKSVHSRQFWYTAKTEYDIKEKKYPNILQMMCYAVLLDKPKGILVFVSKDDLAIDEYEFETTAWKAHIEAELGILRRYWSSDTLPPAEPRAYEGKECKFCIYRNKCNGLSKDISDTGK